MYRFYAELAELTLVAHRKQRPFSAQALAEALTQSGARVVIFSNPCNPTGEGLSRAGLLELVRQRPDVLFIVDEAYMDFSDQSLLADAPSLPNLIVLRTLSKAWGAAGVRLGFAACCPQLLGALNTARSPYNLSSLSQLLGRLLLEAGSPAWGHFLGGRRKSWKNSCAAFCLARMSFPPAPTLCIWKRQTPRRFSNS